MRSTFFILLHFNISSIIYALANEITIEANCELSDPLGASWTFCTLEVYQVIQNRGVTVGNILYKYGQTEYSGNFSITEFKIDSQVVFYMPKIPSFTEVEKISIINSRLLEIHSEDFQPYPSLMTLNLTANGIQKLEKDLFQHTTNIRKLDLSNNQITFIHPGTFVSLDNLNFLNLDHNKCINDHESNRAALKLFADYINLKCAGEGENVDQMNNIDKLETRFNVLLIISILIFLVFLLFALIMILIFHSFKKTILLQMRREKLPEKVDEEKGIDQPEYYHENEYEEVHYNPNRCIIS